MVKALLLERKRISHNGNGASKSNDVIPTKKKTDIVSKHVAIQAPNMQTAAFRIVGTSPYVQHKFSAKAQKMMAQIEEAGSLGKKGKKREAKDYNELYEAAMYKSKEGFFGIPAPTFRNAMISVCRVVGFAMTMAKLSVFVEADCYDAENGDPLVKITKGKPHMDVRPGRVKSGGAYLTSRPMFDPGWEAVVRVKFDADQFSITDITNLLMRVGMQNGIGEGRAFSKDSNGLGWGFFEIKE